MDTESYFVRKLAQSDRPSGGEEFEIQVLDHAGLAIGVGYLTRITEQLTIGGREIPRSVIEAAKRREEGFGDYVGPDGKSVRPF